MARTGDVFHSAFDMPAPMTTPSPDAIRLRPARPDDALCLGVLATQVFLDTYASGGIRPALAREVRSVGSTEAFEARLADAATGLVVAERDGHLVGFAEVGHGAGHELLPGRRGGELRRLYVQEPFTGAGIGRRLLQAAEALVVARGGRVSWLTAWVGNARALAFYPRQGYAAAGSTNHLFEGESHENRLFVKELLP